MSKTNNAREALKKIPSLDEILQSFNLDNIPLQLFKDRLRKSLQKVRDNIKDNNIPVFPIEELSPGIRECAPSIRGKYNNNQIQSKGNVKDGKKVGKWTSWYDDGLISSEKHYKNGDLVNKTLFTFHVNGQIESENHYKDGDLVKGARFTYYDNDQIESEKNYKGDLLSGKVTFWYKDGQKFIDGSYKDEKPDGKWTFWHTNGQIESEENFNDGDLVNRTIFKYSFFTGHLKSKKKYIDGKCISGC